MPKQVKGGSWGATKKGKPGTGVKKSVGRSTDGFRAKGGAVCAPESSAERKDRILG